MSSEAEAEGTFSQKGLCSRIFAGALGINGLMFSVHMLITVFSVSLSVCLSLSFCLSLCRSVSVSLSLSLSLSDWDSDMATLLLLLHLLPPTAGRKKRTKISSTDAAERMVLFHKVNSS